MKPKDKAREMLERYKEQGGTLTPEEEAVFLKVLSRGVGKVSKAPRARRTSLKKILALSDRLDEEAAQRANDERLARLDKFKEPESKVARDLRFRQWADRFRPPR